MPAVSLLVWIHSISYCGIKSNPMEYFFLFNAQVIIGVKVAKSLDMNPGGKYCTVDHVFTVVSMHCSVHYNTTMFTTCKSMQTVLSSTAVVCICSRVCEN